MLGQAHPDTEDYTPEARAHVVDLAHVTGHRDREVVNHQAEVEEIHVPAIEAEVGDRGEAASTQDSTFFEEIIADEVCASTPSLPGGEDEEQAESNDNHNDEGRTLVLRAAVLLKTEGEEQENPSSHKKDSTNNCITSAAGQYRG